MLVLLICSVTLCCYDNESNIHYGINLKCECEIQIPKMSYIERKSHMQKYVRSAPFSILHIHLRTLPLFCQQFEQWQTKNTIAQIITFGRIMRRVNSCHLFYTDGLHSNGNIVSVCERVCHIHRVD